MYREKKNGAKVKWVLDEILTRRILDWKQKFPREQGWNLYIDKYRILYHVLNGRVYIYIYLVWYYHIMLWEKIY